MDLLTHTPMSKASASNPKPKKVTLKDIAKRANLSISAVSLALRGHPSISEKSRERIHQIRRDLGYNPFAEWQENAGAAPTTGAALRIGYCLVGDSLQDEANVSLADGIIRSCQEWKAQLAIEQIAAHSLPKKQILMPTGEAPTGYVLTGFLTDEFIDYFSQDGMPVVIIGGGPSNRKVPNVSLDFMETARVMVEAALRDGNRNFLYIAANLESAHNVQFLHSLRFVLSTAGYSLPDENVIVAPSVSLHDPKHLEKVAAISRKPTAILTAGEGTADRCATILYAKGWIEAKKLSIYSMRPSAAREVNPLYHSLNVGSERLGQIAVDRLAQMILGHATCTSPYTSLIGPIGWMSKGDE